MAQLTATQQGELAGLAKAGDRGAMAELWEQWKPHAWRESRKRAKLLPGVEPEDLCQEGFFGLARAVEKFDPARGVAFGTLAHLCIRRAISDHLRRGRGRPLPQAADDLKAEQAHGSDPADLAVEDDVPAIDAAEEVRRLLATLPRQERLIVELAYGITHGYPMAAEDVGKAVGLTAEKVGRVLCRVRRQLREQAELPVAA